MNEFIIRDTGNYGNHPPCHVLDGSHENNHVTTRRVSPQFTFLFSPFYKYGACSSAQDGGYLNVGTFNNQVDPTTGLSLLIQRTDALEQYQFNYFLIKKTVARQDVIIFLVKFEADMQFFFLDSI